MCQTASACLCSCPRARHLVQFGPRAAAQDPIPYGSPITLEQARKVVAAAEAEAIEHKWPVAIAVVDGAGHLVAFARLDNTQLGSVEVAEEKAKTSALFRRPTKEFEDALEKGGAEPESLEVARRPSNRGRSADRSQRQNHQAVGVSSIKASEDGQVAKAGLSGLK